MTGHGRPWRYCRSPHPALGQCTLRSGLPVGSAPPVKERPIRIQQDIRRFPDDSSYDTSFQEFLPCGWILQPLSPLNFSLARVQPFSTPTTRSPRLHDKIVAETPAERADHVFNLHRATPACSHQVRTVEQGHPSARSRPGMLEVGIPVRVCSCNQVIGIRPQADEDMAGLQPRCGETCITTEPVGLLTMTLDPSIRSDPSCRQGACGTWRPPPGRRKNSSLHVGPLFDCPPGDHRILHAHSPRSSAPPRGAGQRGWLRSGNGLRMSCTGALLGMKHLHFPCPP